MHLKSGLFSIILFFLAFTATAAIDTIVLQQDLNEYSGTSDTYIGQGQPSSQFNQGHKTYTHVGRC